MGSEAEQLRVKLKDALDAYDAEIERAIAAEAEVERLRMLLERPGGAERAGEAAMSKNKRIPLAGCEVDFWTSHIELHAAGEHIFIPLAAVQSVRMVKATDGTYNVTLYTDSAHYELGGTDKSLVAPFRSMMARVYGMQAAHKL